MAEASQISPGALCAEILANAKLEREEILRRANAEAETTSANAKAEAEKIRLERREQTLTEAARRRELILAMVSVETSRLRAARVEMLLESIHEEIRDQLLTQSLGTHEMIIGLAAEAIRHMTGNNFVVNISAAHQAAPTGRLAGEIAQRVGRSCLNLTIVNDEAITSGGVTIQDTDGFQFWDNRLLPRLNRLWPELRRQIAVHTLLTEENHSVRGGS